MGEDDAEQIDTVGVETGFNGWLSIRMCDANKGKTYRPDNKGCIEAKFFWFKIPSIQNNQYEMRVRQMIVYGQDVEAQIVVDSYSNKLQRVKDGALDLFRRLVSRTFLPMATATTIKQEEE